MSEIRVVVVADDEMRGECMASVLADFDDLDVVGQASNGALAVGLAGEVHPNVLMLALSVPDGRASAAIREIVAEHPGARIIVEGGRGDEGDIGVVVLAGREAESGIGAALGAGACGYLSCDTSFEDALAAIRAAASGHAWLSSGAARYVFRRLRPIWRAPRSADEFVTDFSPRELDVLGLLARDLAITAIAAELDISVVTVGRFISGIAHNISPPRRWRWHGGAPGQEGLGGVREPRRPQPEIGGGSVRLQPPQP
jgi:DNA-binding NarL/FixJ family response regulator